MLWKTYVLLLKRNMPQNLRFNPRNLVTTYWISLKQPLLPHLYSHLLIMLLHQWLWTTTTLESKLVKVPMPQWNLCIIRKITLNMPWKYMRSSSWMTRWRRRQCRERLQCSRSLTIWMWLDCMNWLTLQDKYILLLISSTVYLCSSMSRIVVELRGKCPKLSADACLSK